MKRTLSTSSAIASMLLALVAVATVRASLRPRYGGTLRVEMHARPNSMDPRDWYAGAPDSASTERLLALVFDRLISLDESGRIVPSLALAWQHDANFTHWQFLMREGVRFHDGTPLNAAAAAAALELEAADQWPAKPNDNFLTFTFAAPRPELLSELVHGRSFIFRATQDSVIGSGPFRIADWQPQRNLALIANEDSWSGRPFIDRAEFQFGIPPSQQSIDLELGKTDIAELLPAQTRTAPRGGARVTSSSPVELLALVAANSRNAAASADPNLRRALSLSIDRGSIVNVLLQHQGERAGSLLPQWISGYAFAFPTATNIDHARQLRAQLSANPALTLVYDGADSVAAQIAERIAVNARDAGIIVNISPESGSAAARADFRLVRERIMPSDARESLNVLLSRIEPQSAAPKPDLDSPEQRYSAERAAVDSGAIIPLAFVPEIYGVSNSVHDWISPRWGGWQLADVWLEQSAHAAVAAAPEK